MPGEHQRHQQDSDRHDEHMPRAPEVESTDASQQDIRHGQVKQAPEDVDRRRRQTLAGWRREGALKRVAGDAVDQVGDCVGQENAT